MAGPLGMLIVVILKARNLPNKQRIGKQDPYATCTYLSHRKRTHTDKRGGQHPLWDDELRFDIYEKPSDAMAPSAVTTTATGGVGPIKDQKQGDDVGVTGASLGSKAIRISVYADDPKDPELIGECTVDLADTLKKGEFDEWVTITNRGKYSGEVYLEMTYYSALPPADRRQGAPPPRAGVHETQSPKRRWTVSRPGPSASAAAVSGPDSRIVSGPSPAHGRPVSAALDSVPEVLRVGQPDGLSKRYSGPTSPAPVVSNGLPLPGQAARPLEHSTSSSPAGPMLEQSAMPWPPVAFAGPGHPSAALHAAPAVGWAPHIDEASSNALDAGPTGAAYWTSKPPTPPASTGPGYLRGGGMPIAVDVGAMSGQRPPQPHSAPPVDTPAHYHPRPDLAGAAGWHAQAAYTDPSTAGPTPLPALPTVGTPPGRRPLPMPDARLGASIRPSSANPDLGGQPVPAHHYAPTPAPDHYGQGYGGVPAPHQYTVAGAQPVIPYQGLPPPPPGQTPVPFQQVLRASSPLPHPGYAYASDAHPPPPVQSQYPPPSAFYGAAQPPAPYPQTTHYQPAAPWTYGGVPPPSTTPLPPPPPGQVPYAYGAPYHPGA